ncbi:hypothetical protein GCM10020220_085830 [Nonomuraea rubra]|uniref:TetR/AcrR family transcriptional regulator n=1 Tax=Nonomuraea rubra TaxID=46180 RepID=UPI0031ECE3AE
MAAASTRAIAAELGIAQATVHYVYGAKDELYRAVIEQLTADIAEQVRAIDIPAGPDFHAIIGAFAQRLWRTVVEQPHVHQLIAELFVMGLRSRPCATIAACISAGSTASSRTRSDGRHAAYAGMTLAHPVRGGGPLLLRRARRADPAAARPAPTTWRDERSLLQIVAATTALAEGRCPSRGPGSGDPTCDDRHPCTAHTLLTDNWSVVPSKRLQWMS